MEPLIQKLGITTEEAKEISLKDIIVQRIFLAGYNKNGNILQCSNERYLEHSDYLERDSGHYDFEKSK